MWGIFKLFFYIVDTEKIHDEKAYDSGFVCLKNQFIGQVAQMIVIH